MNNSSEKIVFDNKILERILDIAGLMLTAGGEVRRVEDTISILCRAYGASHADVFTITSSIVVTVRFEEGEPLTQTRRMASQNTDLSKLAKLNALSRDICACLKTSEQIKEELEKINTENTKPVLMMCAWAMVSGAFAMFFGGNIWDGICSAVVGIFVCIFKTVLSKYLRQNYIIIILCSLFGGVLGECCSKMFEDISPFFINIGNIMLLIPGIALTTAVRDMFSGDTISGLLRTAEAMLVSLMIAWGFAMFSVSGGISDAITNQWIQLACAFVGSLGFAVLFNCYLKNTIISSVLGFLGWGIVLLIQNSGISEYIAYFAAAMFITLCAEIMARVNHCPATVFFVVGTIPLIPGKALYTTMHYALMENWRGFFGQGLATALYAVAIAAGIVIVTAFFNGRKKIAMDK